MSRSAVTQALGRLSPRDREVVATLAELRVATAPQLERWHFAGATPLARARAARRSLAQLVSLGVLTRLDRRIGGVRAGSAGYVYGLDLLGQRIAQAQGWLPPARTRRVREPSRLFLRHQLAVGELHLQLVEADRTGIVLELQRREPEPACWRTYLGGGGHPLILKPDFFTVVAAANLELSWFGEIDLHTHSLAAIDRKCRTYIDYWRTGTEVAERGVQPRTLWLVPGEGRRAQLERTIRRLPMEAQPLFAVALMRQAIAAVTDEL
jgi:hypothetical protein